MFNYCLKKLLSAASSTRAGNKLNILTYHRVANQFSPERHDELSIDQFRAQMRWLKENFNVLPIDVALDAIESKTLPRRAISITVDDGYEDSYFEIFTVLKELGLTATFFITTSGIEEGILWDEKLALAIYHAPFELSVVALSGQKYNISTFADKVRVIHQLSEAIKYLPIEERNVKLENICQQTQFEHSRKLFLTPEQIKEMSLAGMEIGAHTHRHPILTCETLNDAKAEIVTSKEILERITGKEVQYFAYPNGKRDKDFSQEHEALIKEIGFKAAFSTNWGTLKDLDSERFKIKRFTPWDLSKFKFCFRLMFNYWKGYDL